MQPTGNERPIKTLSELTEIDKGLILKYWQIGYTYSQIAENFETDKLTVMYILNI